MLITLSVRNLAIVAELELNFAAGMHVITGETGAGKSIIIEALGLALGERASPDQIRASHTQAEVCASFDIRKLPKVQELLQEQELNAGDDCIIRRIINSDGRSRAYVNGHNVTIQQLRTLAPHLVHIHGQHQHHALLDSDYQRDLLDSYADHVTLQQTVRNCYQAWVKIKQEIQTLSDATQQTDRLHLLNYQIQELTSLNLQTNELIKLEQQHRELAKAEELIATCQKINTILTGDSLGDDSTNVLMQLHAALQQMQGLLKIAPALNTANELIQQAIIQVTESSAELNNYFAKLEIDPSKLQEIEQRLSAIHALARKLKVTPELLEEHQTKLCAERDKLESANERLAALQQALQKCEAEYMDAAAALSESRQQAATRLSRAIMQRLKQLELLNAKFEINLEELKHNNPSPYGNENISFLITTNPGQPLGLLKKIASGGELSRVSLAIQVISAQRMATPTLILDEVDVGISGKTAATVGQIIRELGNKAQVLCITHLAQVAAYGELHFKVEKKQSSKNTFTQINLLNHDQRVQELARLIGGAEIAPEAIAYAERMLAPVE